MVTMSPRCNGTEGYIRNSDLMRFFKGEAFKGYLKTDWVGEVVCSAEKLKKRFGEPERGGRGEGKRQLGLGRGRRHAGRPGRRPWPHPRPRTPARRPRPHPWPHPRPPSRPPPRPRTAQRPPQLVPPAGKPRADAGGCCADGAPEATAQGRAEATPTGVPGGSAEAGADGFLGVLRAAEPTRPRAHLQALCGRVGCGRCVRRRGPAGPGGLRVPGPGLQSRGEGCAPRWGPHRPNARAPRAQTEGQAQWRGEAGCRLGGWGAGGLPGVTPRLRSACSARSPSPSGLQACQGRPQGPKRDLDLGWSFRLSQGRT